MSGDGIIRLSPEEFNAKLTEISQGKRVQFLPTVTRHNSSLKSAIKPFEVLQSMLDVLGQYESFLEREVAVSREVGEEFINVDKYLSGNSID